METFVSIDIEADGPIPGPHSMLSLGAAAFDHHERLLATHEVNLELLEGATPHPDTVSFWAKHPKAFRRTRKNTIPPSDAMKAFAAWLKELPNRPVMVGYPAAYDFMFTYWYLMFFVGRCPFSHSALDIKTLAADRLKIPYRDVSKSIMPPQWLSESTGEEHHAAQDAINQGHLYFKVKSHR